MEPLPWIGLLATLAILLVHQASSARLRRAMDTEHSLISSSRATSCKLFCRTTGFQGSVGDCSCGYIIFQRKRSVGESVSSWGNPPGCESFCLSTGWKQRIGSCNCGTYVIAMKRSQEPRENLEDVTGANQGETDLRLYSLGSPGDTLVRLEEFKDNSRED